MLSSYAKSTKYADLAPKDKANVVKTFCDSRIATWNKYYGPMFGNHHNAYIATVTAISDLLNAFINDDLDTCLRKGYEAFDKNVSRDVYLPPFEEWESNPINEFDLECALDIAHQSIFQSNRQFVEFAKKQIEKEPYALNQLSDAKKSPSVGFKYYLEGVIDKQENDWANLLNHSYIGRKGLSFLAELIPPGMAVFGVALLVQKQNLGGLALLLTGYLLRKAKGALTDRAAVTLFSGQEKNNSLYQIEQIKAKGPRPESRDAIWSAWEPKRASKH